MSMHVTKVPLYLQIELNKPLLALFSTLEASHIVFSSSFVLVSQLCCRVEGIGWGGSSHVRYSVDIQPSPPHQKPTYSVDIQRSTGHQTSSQDSPLDSPHNDSSQSYHGHRHMQKFSRWVKYRLASPFSYFLTSRACENDLMLLLISLGCIAAQAI